MSKLLKFFIKNDNVEYPAVCYRFIINPDQSGTILLNKNPNDSIKVVGQFTSEEDMVVVLVDFIKSTKTNYKPYDRINILFEFIK